MLTDLIPCLAITPDADLCRTVVFPPGKTDIVMSAMVVCALSTASSSRASGPLGADFLVCVCWGGLVFGKGHLQGIERAGQAL